MLAIQLLCQHCKKLKYIKNIVLVTNAVHLALNCDDVDEIAKKLAGENIALTILWVSCRLGSSLLTRAQRSRL